MRPTQPAFESLAQSAEHIVPTPATRPTIEQLEQGYAEGLRSPHFTPRALFQLSAWAGYLLEQAPSLNTPEDARLVQGPITADAIPTFAIAAANLSKQIYAQSEPATFSDFKPSVLRPMVKSRAASLANWDSTIQPDEEMTSAAFELYLLTLLRGNDEATSHMVRFMREQSRTLITRASLPENALKRTIEYIEAPWKSSYPTITTGMYGAQANTQNASVLRTSFNLLSFSHALASQTNTLATRDLTRQLCSRWQHTYPVPPVSANPTPPDVDRTFDAPQATNALASIERSTVARPRLVEWEILPSGSMNSTSSRIVKEAQARVTKRRVKPLEVDPRRVEILELFEELWDGPTYAVRGRYTSRDRVRDKRTGHLIPQDYIVLVLHKTDSAGNISAEYAIAASPVTENALYVYRQDVAGGEIGDWELLFDIVRSTQSHTTGVRAVNFVTSKDKDLTETMFEKIIYLLECKPEDFKSLQFAGLDRKGSGRVAVRYDRLRNRAARAALRQMGLKNTLSDEPTE